MSCNKIPAAVITPVLAAGAVASPYFVAVNSTPVFDPKFSLKSVAQVGADQYMATIHVEGIIAYVPCNGGCNCTKQQPLSQDFTIPIQASSAPTVTIEAGAATNAVAAAPCQVCSRAFVSETPLAITVATSTPA